MNAAPQDFEGPVAVLGDVVLGKYRVERIIGEGGMGIVFAVRHVELGELFAMKVLKPSALRELRAAERFAREARAVARLKSEHVARVFDVGQLDNGLPYMLLEYLEGKDLATLLHEEGSLSAREAIDCLLLTLDAVIEAHDQGIVHRDLKPENLFLVSRPDGSATIKVLDFGISKDLRRNEAFGGSVTHTSNVMGSPFYMSPEQIRSSKHVDERADLWALGVIVYELLTCSVPFPGETITQVCANMIEHSHPDVALLAPGTPPLLIEVIDRCFRRDITKRYQTARELAEALRCVGDCIREPRGFHLESVRRLAPRLPMASRTRSHTESGNSDPRSSSGAITLPAGAPDEASAPFTAAQSNWRGRTLALLLGALGLFAATVWGARASRAHFAVSESGEASLALASARHDLSPALGSTMSLTTTVATPIASARSPAEPPKLAPKPRPIRSTASPAPRGSASAKPATKHEGIY